MTTTTTTTTETKPTFSEQLESARVALSIAISALNSALNDADTKAAAENAKKAVATYNAAAANVRAEMLVITAADDRTEAWRGYLSDTRYDGKAIKKIKGVYVADTVKRALSFKVIEDIARESDLLPNKSFFENAPTTYAAVARFAAILTKVTAAELTIKGAPTVIQPTAAADYAPKTVSKNELERQLNALVALMTSDTSTKMLKCDAIAIKDAYVSAKGNTLGIAYKEGDDYKLIDIIIGAIFHRIHGLSYEIKSKSSAFKKAEAK